MEELNGDSLALLAALDRLRQDFREDLQAHEGRMRGELSEIRQDVQDFVISHAEAHSLEASVRAEAHARYDQFIDDSRLARARRDGALGALRFVSDLTVKNWRLIVSFLFFLMTVLGSVRVTIGS